MTADRLSISIVTSPRIAYGSRVLLRCVAGIKACFAPAAPDERYRARVDLERGYEYWLDALRPADHPREIR